MERIYRGDFSSLEEFLVRRQDRLSMRAAMELVDTGVFDESGMSRESLRNLCDSFYRGAPGAPAPRAHPQRPPRAGKGRTGTRQISLFDPDGDDGSNGPSGGGRSG